MTKQVYTTQGDSSCLQNKCTKLFFSCAFAHSANTALTLTKRSIQFPKSKLPSVLDFQLLLSLHFCSVSRYPPNWDSGVVGDTQNVAIPDTVSFPSEDHLIINQMTPSATLIDPMFLFGRPQSQGPWIEDNRAANGELDFDWSFLQVPNMSSDMLL